MSNNSFIITGSEVQNTLNCLIFPVCMILCIALLVKNFGNYGKRCFSVIFVKQYLKLLNTTASNFKNKKVKIENKTINCY